MREEMRKAQTKEIMRIQLSERKDYGNRCFEKWSNMRNVGEGLDKIMGADEEKARSLAIILENQERYLQSLTETQISTAFQTTPENVIRVVRLGYPNSVRGDIFLDWAMESARDSIYYLAAKYGKTKRGATAGNRMLDYATGERFASEVEEYEAGEGDDSTVEFTGTVDNAPLRKYSVIIYVNGEPVGTDNGSGTISGDGIDASGTNMIAYDTGNFNFTLSEAPSAGETVIIQCNYLSEDADQYNDLGSVELQLRAYQFRVYPHPLFISYSKMVELLLGTTLNIDAEEALLQGAADELKKSLDMLAVRLAYRYSKTNATTTFSAAISAGETREDKATQLSEYIDRMGNAIYDDLNRGGITKLFGGGRAIAFLKLHKRFSPAGKQPKVGAFKVGVLDGIDIFQVPTVMLGGTGSSYDNQLVGVWKNDQQPEDVSIAFGTLIPMYQTMNLEYKEMYTEKGLAYFGDKKVLQPKYLRRLTISNL